MFYSLCFTSTNPYTDLYNFSLLFSTSGSLTWCIIFVLLPAFVNPFQLVCLDNSTSWLSSRQIILLLVSLTLCHWWFNCHFFFSVNFIVFLKYSFFHSVFVLIVWVYWASLVAQMVKNPPAMQKTQVRSLGQEDPLEKRMATHHSIFVWRIPWTLSLAD